MATVLSFFRLWVMFVMITFNEKIMARKNGDEKNATKLEQPTELRALVIPEIREASKVDTFVKVVDESVFAIVMFYAPWCRYSQELAPEFAKTAVAATRKKSLRLTNFIRVNCVVARALCSANDIKGYPTLKLYRHGKVADFVDERDTSELLEYLAAKTALADASVLSLTPVEGSNALRKTFRLPNRGRSAPPMCLKNGYHLTSR